MRGLVTVDPERAISPSQNAFKGGTTMIKKLSVAAMGALVALTSRRIGAELIRPGR